MSLFHKCVAEFIGTFWLVFGGCGTAVIAAVVLKQQGSTPLNLGIAYVGVSLAFGLTVLTMAYAIGHISGCHLNPAVSTGLMLGGRFSPLEIVPYVLAQVGGAVAGAAVLWLIMLGKPGWLPGDGAGAFATNGYDKLSPGEYALTSCFQIEFVLTFFFLFIILGSTDGKAPAGFAAIPIGLGLTLIHLIGIDVTNLSVNPARSTGPALFAGGQYIMQLWLFWLAPLAGAAAAGITYRTLYGDGKAKPEPSSPSA